MSDWEDQVRVKAGKWATRTLLFSPEQRLPFYVSLVKQGRPKERHIDHWVDDCLDRLVYNAQEVIEWGFSGEDIAAYAYMKSYEDVLKGVVYDKGFHKESSLGRTIRLHQQSTVRL